MGNEPQANNNRRKNNQLEQNENQYGHQYKEYEVHQNKWNYYEKEEVENPSASDESIVKIKRCISKVFTEEDNGSGFFLLLPVGGNLLKTFITCNHVITYNQISRIASVRLEYDYRKRKVTISLNRNERMILTFEKENEDVTIFEILEKDNIPNDLYLEVDPNYPNNNYNYNFDFYINKLVRIFGYVKDSFRDSIGTVVNILDSKYTFCYDAGTDHGNSGSPVIYNRTLKVIGVHNSYDANFPYNKGSFIGYIINKLKNIKICSLFLELKSQGIASKLLNITKFNINKKENELVGLKILVSPQNLSGNMNEIINNWESAWKGTKYEYLTSIARNGLKASSFNAPKRQCNFHYDKQIQGIENWGSAIFVSPSIFYTGSKCYSERINDDEKEWAVMVETKVRPQSYTKHESTFFYNPKIDEPNYCEYRIPFSNNNFEEKKVVVVSLTFVLSDFFENTTRYSDGAIFLNRV